MGFPFISLKIPAFLKKEIVLMPKNKIGVTLANSLTHWRMFQVYLDFDYSHGRKTLQRFFPMGLCQRLVISPSQTHKAKTTSNDDANVRGMFEMNYLLSYISIST